MAALYRKVADSLGVSLNEASVADQPNMAQFETFLENYPQVKKIVREWSQNDVDAPPAVDVSDLADHIDYMVTRIGIDHVGISSDFDGGGGIEGWMDASETFNVTLELVERGYSAEEISKLWGGNLLRVMEEVQKAAGREQNL
jgi:membrane dipeptidase